MNSFRWHFKTIIHHRGTEQIRYWTHFGKYWKVNGCERKFMNLIRKTRTKRLTHTRTRSPIRTAGKCSVEIDLVICWCAISISWHQLIIDFCQLSRIKHFDVNKMLASHAKCFKADLIWFHFRRVTLTLLCSHTPLTSIECWQRQQQQSILVTLPRKAQQSSTPLFGHCHLYRQDVVVDATTKLIEFKWSKDQKCKLTEFNEIWAWVGRAKRTLCTHPTWIK